MKANIGDIIDEGIMVGDIMIGDILVGDIMVEDIIDALQGRPPTIQLPLAEERKKKTKKKGKTEPGKHGQARCEFEDGPGPASSKMPISIMTCML